MSLLEVKSFACGEWHEATSQNVLIKDAATGQDFAIAGTTDFDFQDVIDYATSLGGPALRAMTFHDRARMLKALALYMHELREQFYELSYATGATLSDSKIDIDGGIGTMLVMASKGRREMPDQHVYLDGQVEALSRKGSFLGQHICTPLQGVAVHINAFNFPVWGMLEKLAPTLLAGMPAIVKSATSTCYLTEAFFRSMIESGILTAGAVQLIVGKTGDLLDRLSCQDVVSFTGSAATASKLRSNPKLIENSVRFVAEQDSLNASVLGQDARKGSPEFDLFIDEVVREMTTKAGQKCTAIRRILVPEAILGDITVGLKDRLDNVSIGNPRDAKTDMGALVSENQQKDVLEKAALIGRDAELVSGDGKPRGQGNFLRPMLFACPDPDQAKNAHSIEAFGPVATVMAYSSNAQAVSLLNKGAGSLVASVITHDPSFARDIALGSAAFHGRIYINDRVSMAESTGHGSPLPHMVHGGPGRAGGGEELGGVRGVLHYMQRTAIQGSPDMLTAISGQWVPGAPKLTKPDHPFRRSFDELEIGETLETSERRISMEDIETFAHFTGDTFYAHMDEEAAAANPFFPGRVAHGYLLLSFAAGLFVDPDPGPVLANTGLNNLSFQKPVSAGDAIKVYLTVKRKTKRNDSYGEVAWNVEIVNQNAEQVAQYELLTMNAYAPS